MINVEQRLVKYNEQVQYNLNSSILQGMEQNRTVYGSRYKNKSETAWKQALPSNSSMLAIMPHLS